MDLSQQPIEIQSIILLSSYYGNYTRKPSIHDYTGKLHWSADTLFKQLSVDHNMDVHYQVKHIFY